MVITLNQKNGKHVARIDATTDKITIKYIEFKDPEATKKRVIAMLDKYFKQFEKKPRTKANGAFFCSCKRDLKAGDLYFNKKSDYLVKEFQDPTDAKHFRVFKTETVWQMFTEAAFNHSFIKLH